MKGNRNHFQGSGSGFSLDEGNEDSAVGRKLGKRHKSFARAQMLVKRLVVDTAVQEMQSHVELYLGLGRQGSSGMVCLGFPCWHTLL